MIVTLKKWGNGQAIRFSKEFLSSLNLKVDDELDVEVIDDKVILTKHKAEINLDELFASYKGDKPKEFDWTEPVGGEEW